KTREHLDTFWELIDEVLNAILFLLIGLELLVITFTGTYFLAGLVAIPAVLLARFIAVGVPIAVLRQYRPFTPHAVKILTWGGLKGGLSVAMALSIPRAVAEVDPAWREAILAATYTVVIFSIAVQGLSLGPLVRHWARPEPAQTGT
ncbi:MAG: cation:proton antiporter, partial [Phycisphaeraceae bacterium]|nr:cation:proton antiporter [Phycisphaeraceae bacterium]